jgi:2-oxoglutarate dehydrogenase E2 component (dihydrolipoamide succinyltransferase)
MDILFPASGESVRTGVISRLSKKDGEAVRRDETVVEIETDKITVEVPAPAAGTVRYGVKVGDTVEVGAPLGRIEEGTAPAAPATSNGAPQPAAVASTPHAAHAPTEARATPLARKAAEQLGVDLAKVPATGPGGRVQEKDVLTAAAPKSAPTPVPATPATPAAVPSAAPQLSARREPLPPIRQRIAARLVEAQHTAAMLTTFNEVDMTAAMDLRKKYKEDFEKKHGVGLGFMSFFVKAAVNALKTFPLANAYLVSGERGLEVQHHDTCDVAVAVSSPKGLVVPVVRRAETLSFAEIEAQIKALAVKARDGKLTLEEMQGGTFTITNGGIFGSLMSTPILNAPQSAILGMHAIKNRPVEHPDKPGEIALRPMMYLALSYDHRLLDGSTAVSFLVAIKNAVERPERLLLEM